MADSVPSGHQDQKPQLRHPAEVSHELRLLGQVEGTEMNLEYKYRVRLLGQTVYVLHMRSKATAFTIQDHWTVIPQLNRKKIKEQCLGARH